MTMDLPELDLCFIIGEGSGCGRNTDKLKLKESPIWQIFFFFPSKEDSYIFLLPFPLQTKFMNILKLIDMNIESHYVSPMIRAIKQPFILAKSP